MTRAGVISTTTYLLIAGIRPGFAKISDVFGYLHALVLSTTLHTLGFLICAVAQSFNAVFAGSVISGIGQGGYGTLVSMIIADILPIHLRGSITAYVSIPNITNYYLGIEVGNGLYNKWHWVYGILCILAVVCSIPAFLALYRVDRHTRNAMRIANSTNTTITKTSISRRIFNALLKLDIPGLVLLCGGLLCILSPLGMQLNLQYGWNSAQVIAPLVIGLITLSLFVIYEYKYAAYPVIAFPLLKNKTFACAISAATLFFFTTNVSLFYFNPFIQVTRDVSAHTAMLLQLGTVGYNVGLFFGGWAMQYSKKYRRWAWLGWTLVLAAVCLMLLARGGSSGSTNAIIAVVQAIYGIGGGILVGCLGIGVQAAVSKADLSIAITLYSMVEYIGGVLGEGASTTIWVNLLPTRLQGKMDANVDIFSAINDITYYQSLPKDQRIIVQDGYISTQRILTICGICSILLTGVAMLGLARSNLSDNAAPLKIDSEFEDNVTNSLRYSSSTSDSKD